MKKTSKALLSTVAALTVTLSSVGLPLASVPLISQTSMTAYAAASQSVQYYKLNVTGGKLSNGKTSGVAKTSQFITVKTDTAPDGKKFSHWTRNGIKASTNTSYSFYMPNENVNLEAVFVSESNTVNEVGTAIIESVTPNKSTGKVTFVSALNVPDNCTYVKGGLVATNDESIGSNVDASNATYVKLSSKGISKTKNLKYTWTKSGVTENTIWYVKGYLVYKDVNGIEQTVYSDCVATNINGVVEQTSQQNGVFLDKQANILTIKGAVTDSDIKNFDYGDDYSPQSVKKIYAEKGSSLTGNMDSIFMRCYNAEEIDLSNLNTSGITNMDHMFAYLERVKKINLHGIDTSNVTNMHWMFYDCLALEELDITGLDTSKVTDMDYLFAYNRKLTEINVSGFDLSSLKTALCMFYDCESITELDLSQFNMPNLENACLIAAHCYNLETAKFGNSSTSKLDNAASLFYNCSLLKNVDVSTLNTSNVTNMNGMFQSCTSLESVDVSSFNTSKVTNMGAMFRECTNLKSIDVSGFDTSKVTSIYEMFRDCPALTTIDVDGFNTSNVTDMNGMFRNCSGLTSLDVSGFNTAKVTNMAYMFSGCTVLPFVDLTGFNYSKITKYANYSTMFDDSPLLLANVVSAYRTELTNGYMAKLRIYITPGDNAAKAVVSIGNQSQEFSRDEWNLSSGNNGYIIFNFKSNAVPSSEKFNIKFYDAEDRQLPVRGESNSYSNYAEFTRSSSDVTRTYFRVTTVVGDTSSYVEYNAGNKKLVLDKYFISSSLIPDGYKLSGWEVNGNSYPLNYEYWTGGRDTTVTAIFVEKPVREMLTLSLDAPVQGHWEDGDSDTFSFTAAEAGTYVFTSEGGYRLTGCLYSNAAMTDLIAYDDYSNGASNFRVKVELAAGQTVYMKNQEYYGVSKIYDYTVKVRKMSDIPRKTSALSLDTSVTGHYEDIDEFDDFSFTAPEDGIYLFTGENTEGEISGYLYSDAELTDYITSSSDYGSFKIRAELTEGQTVYLKPVGYYDYSSCDYTVSVSKKEIVAREPIALDLDTETYGEFGDIDDYDRFSFTAEEDGTYIFKGTTSQMRDIYGYLYSDEEMTESIDSGYPNWSDNYVYFTLRVELTAGQTVYLKPEIDDDYGSCDYIVMVKKKNYDAIEMTLNTPISGHFENSEEFDFFSFTAPSEGAYVFTSDCYYDTYGYLYGDADLSEQLALNDDDGGNMQFRIEYYLEAEQTVYLLPIRYGWGESCDYTVTVKKVVEPLDVYNIEELDATISIDSAKESEQKKFSCSSSTAYVKINADNLVDDSSVTVTYGIDLELDPDEAEYEIVLYDANGSAIVSVNDYAVVKSVNFSVDSGCAFIKITRLDGKAIGDAMLEYTYLGRSIVIYR